MDCLRARRCLREQQPVCRRRGARYGPIGLSEHVVCRETIHFVMERQQLLGIAYRAEYQPTMPSEADHSTYINTGTFASDNTR